MNYRVIVTAAIFNDNKILLGRKPKGIGPYPDTWHMPGGGINLGQETCEQAMEREIFEETGLKVKNLQKLSWNTDVEPDKRGEETYYIFLKYKCEYESGELDPKDDLEKLEWVDLDKLPAYKVGRQAEILFKQLGLLK